jgi:Ca-activated chloride channel family protein
VRRVVLVSDGLDSGRAQSERLALSALDSHTTVSALGIGLDFDEGSMSSVANAGRGNFGFVENAGALSRFLQRELEETAKTVVESAQARLELPAGARFIRAVGAQANLEGNELTLTMGSLFAGDERRVVVELSVDAEQGEALPLQAQVSWQRVGGDRTNARLAELTMTGERDSDAVMASRDGRVYANALSATASLRQIEASEAYARGDTGRADQLLQQNQIAMKAAVAAAPAEEKESMQRQAADVSETRAKFKRAPVGSPAAKAAGKAAAWKSSENLSRKAY